MIWILMLRKSSRWKMGSILMGMSLKGLESIGSWSWIFEEILKHLLSFLIFVVFGDAW